MEKYRAFADGGTGVHPFLPVWSMKRSHRYLWSLANAPLQFCLCCIRCCLIVILMLWISCCYCINGCMQLIHRRSAHVLKFVLEFVALRLVLMFVGINYINEKTADQRKLKLKSIDEYSVRNVISFCTDNTIILCNYTSYVEVLYLWMKLQPCFTKLHEDGSLSLISPFAAIKHSLQFEVSKGPGSFTTITELLTYKQAHGMMGPIVIFPEAMKSNGCCILKWKMSCFLKEKREEPIKWWMRCNVILVSVAYSFDSHSKTSKKYPPPHTVNSGVGHIMRMCYQYNNSMDVYWYPAYKSMNEIALTDDAVAIVNKLRELSCAMLPRRVLVDVDGESLKEFNEYWKRTQKKNYALKKKS